MADILEGLTPLRRLPKTIDAQCYNRIRVRLLRGTTPLRLRIPDHRGLEMIVTENAWLCVDATQGDQPIAAWSEFETAGRAALHQPVACRLSLYHIHAGLVMGSALQALTEGEWQVVEPG